jgi:hypothetical protein
MKTEGKWSWKLKSFKECVKTHLSNLISPKMDGAKANNRYLTGGAIYEKISPPK